MKFFPKPARLALLFLIAFAALRAELTRWAENVEAGKPLEAVFFRTVTLLTGSVPVRRPPAETRPELTRLIAATPSDPELYSLRALEAEQQLDFAAAEADWKRYLDLAADKGAARIALADFYHRRLKSADEFSSLSLAARENGPSSDKLRPESEQRPWKTYERLMRLAEDARLPAPLSVIQYQAWIQRYPKSQAVYARFFAFAKEKKLYDVGQEILAAQQRAFPADEETLVEWRADLASARGATAEAMSVYERSFKPVWPAGVVKQYFALLKQTNALRTYLESARAALNRNPLDLAATARLFYYWQQQGNPAYAERALVEFREHKDSSRAAWTSEELDALARLHESINDYDEAARCWYALYSLARNDDAAASQALGSLARLLLTVPEQPIRFGSGNLSLYRNVASMDPHPGFLNGVLSLILNDEDLPNAYASEEQTAGAYFRREQGAELVALFESRFPNSTERAPLRERVIEAYDVYGANDAVIRAGTRFLTDFPNASNRTAVALRMAGAYARTNRPAQEFALYDALLKELAARADNVPLGEAPVGASAPNPADSAKVAAVRSPEYAAVLDRYTARLVSLRRIRDAASLIRREIDRNPDDPGLYESLAGFLDRNRLGAETEQVYQSAIARFPDRGWQEKLARWYLRHRRSADMARLTRDVTQTFAGTQLAGYFSQVVSSGPPVGAQLYLQLNLYAHQRFPHNLTFVRNLLTAYGARGTANGPASEALLREHWNDASDLRNRFFELLSRTRRLDTELAAVRGSNPGFAANPAVVEFVAEADAWRCHFENAAPLFLTIEGAYPADASLGSRAGAVYRSLGAFAPRNLDTSVSVEGRLTEADPRNHNPLTRLGEIEADRGRFDRARTWWDRIPEIDPGHSEGYLETATIFWDYYRYEDALRWINQARSRLAQPSLFAYEAGAIYENQRDTEKAILEYAKGALDQPQGNAEKRLLLLARRPALRARIDQLTENLASDRDPRPNALLLRIALLRNQDRRDDLQQFLLAVVSRAASAETLATVEGTGRADGLPRVQQAAMEREIALSNDPVDRMRLRLMLARFLEGDEQIPQAGQLMDAVYRENPAILGVVRADVDYHWRNHQAARAIDVLAEASGRAQPSYARDFLLEAARKATESADYTRAREFASKLLAQDPNDAEYIAVMADVYARQGDDRGLRTFYTEKIGAHGILQEQVASLRRALIPVLKRMKDSAGVVDQYIEILKRYPEDEALTREAAQYAMANGATARLTDYFTKAVSDSPKDFRWPMVLARIQTQMENYPAAIASYTQAAAVRPDRADLLAARFTLENRLLRFEEAAATAEKLYDLTYRDPQWMSKLAEVRARQGRKADAVSALRKALLDGRETAENYFAVASKLESWDMLAEARPAAEEGLKRSKPSDGWYAHGVGIYASILMRQRDYEAYFALFGRSERGEGLSAVTRYYSPEETAKVAARVTLPDQIAHADYLRMMAQPGSPAASEAVKQLIPLQQSRLQFDELGSELEAYDRALPPASERGDELEEAAASYRSSGNRAAELRVLARMEQRAALQGASLERYARLLLAQPQRMTAAIETAASPEDANAIVNYAIQNGSAAVAQQSIAARGKKAGALWTGAYGSLAALYFDTPTGDDFPQILGDMTIGARVGKPVDRNRELAGDIWFYYGGRYGEYLAAMKRLGAEDFLPAMVEASPGRSDAYFTLAEYYRDAGNSHAAESDYRYALDLNPLRADVHDRLAVIRAKAGERDAAIAEWKLALAALSEQMDLARVPATLWNDLGQTIRHIGDANALDDMRATLDRLLRVYIRRNGAFQIDPIFEALLTASKDPAGATLWIADLASAASDPVPFLETIVRASWLPEDRRGVIYEKLMQDADAQSARNFGEQLAESQRQAWSLRVEWIRYLLARRQNPQAREVFAALSAEARKELRSELIPLEIQLAARTNTLPALLARYAAADVTEVRTNLLTEAANTLASDGDARSSRRVLEFLYNRELNGGNLDASNFLGLAEIKLAENDVPGALALLRRMALVSGESFSTLEPAADLLVKTGHAPEAVEFLDALVKSTPWNWPARQRLADARNAVPDLTAIVKSMDAPYETRAAAALDLRKLKAPPVDQVDAELELLSSSTPLTEAVVNRPYYIVSRVAAAHSLADASARVRLLTAVIALDPASSDRKMDLLRAALDGRRDSLAIAVADQLLPAYAREAGAYESFQTDAYFPTLSAPDRAVAVRGLGDAHRRLGELPEARSYYEVAQRIQSEPQIARTLAAVTAQLQIATRNETRRPVVSDGLEQDRLVRPKVSAP